MPVPILRASITAATDEVVDLSSITGRTGLEPSVLYVKGDERVARSGHRFGTAPRSMWCLFLERRSTLDLQAVLDELLDLVEPVGAELREVVAEHDLDLWVSLHIHMEDGQAPDGTISRGSIARLARLGAGLDLDLYPVHVEDETAPPGG